MAISDYAPRPSRGHKKAVPINCASPGHPRLKSASRNDHQVGAHNSTPDPEKYDTNNNPRKKENLLFGRVWKISLSDNFIKISFVLDCCFSPPALSLTLELATSSGVLVLLIDKVITVKFDNIIQALGGKLTKKKTKSTLWDENNTY